VAAGVNNGEDRDRTIVVGEKDTVGKASEESAPNTGANRSKTRRPLRHVHEGLIQRVNKFDTKSSALRLVPSNGVGNLDFRARCNP
jgi:hypothetical protein